MTQNDETMFSTLTSNVENRNNKPISKKSGNSAWEQVAVGGVAGILLGAGGMYAADAFANSSENEELVSGTVHNDGGLKIASNVNDEQPFTDAFDAARAEIGSGGAFFWHGRVYSTYNEDEWNSMTDVEKNDYAETIKPVVRQEETNVAHQSSANVAIVSNQSLAEVHDNNENLHQAYDVQMVDDQSADVHLVNVGEVQLADGSMATIGVYDMDGQSVSVVDFDQDGIPDVAICDANGNGQIDEGEAVDLHTGQVISTNGNDYAVQESVDANPNLQTASMENPDVAPDMPDYMSDADIQMV